MRRTSPAPAVHSNEIIFEPFSSLQIVIFVKICRKSSIVLVTFSTGMSETFFGTLHLWSCVIHSVICQTFLKMKCPPRMPSRESNPGLTLSPVASACPDPNNMIKTVSVLFKPGSVLNSKLHLYFSFNIKELLQ